MSRYEEAWAWIPHTEGADRQKEINAYLHKMVDEMQMAAPTAEVATDSNGRQRQ